jgi:hypothetical protein
VRVVELWLEASAMSCKVPGGVHLHVAVAVKVHDADHD